MNTFPRTVNRGILRWGGNIAAFALVILVNWMANALPIGGQTTGEISAKYPSLFTPAGFTFSIWGLIYLCLGAFVIYQALPRQRNSELLSRIDRAFVLNCVANITWIYVWHHDLLLLSVAIMACILISLIMIYRSIAPSRLSASTWLLVRVPFSLYTGWITVASIASISIVQTWMGWDNVGLDAVHWATIKLAIAGTVGTVMVLRKGDIVFALVIAWAAFGIASKQAAITPEVAGAASLLAIVTLLLAAFQSAALVYRKNRAM